MRRSGALGPLLFIGLPVLEVILIFWVASLIGWLWTFVILLAGFGFGLAMIRLAGTNAYRALIDPVQRAQAFQQVDPETGQASTVHPGHGITPEDQEKAARELRDSALLFVGGSLIAVPGFVTDLIGLVFVFPPTRHVIAAQMRKRSSRRSGVVIQGETVVVDESGVHRTTWGSSGDDVADGGDQVIQGEILPPQQPKPDDR